MENRRKNYVKNVTGTIILQIVNPICVFIARTVFIKQLGAEYLGISGLFTDVLSILSLSELGLGSAVTFALYKPLAENDEEKIAQIMGFLKKSYMVIGWIILGIGMVLMPFLRYIVRWNSAVQINIHLIFALFVLNSAVSYWFFAYRQVLITAAQKLYRMQTVQISMSVVQMIVSIIILILTHNYVIYLSGTILIEILQSCIIAKIANGIFPYAFKKSRGRLSGEEKKSLWHNVYSVFIGNVSYQIFTSTDSIIISGAIDTVAVGILSNYRTIIRLITTGATLFTGSMMPAIGDIVARDDNAECEKKFFRYNFIQMWVTSVFAICVLTGAKPFIQAWIGDGYLETEAVLLILLWNFWSDLSMQIVWQFRAAYGLYTYGKYLRFGGAILNIPLSILWARQFGVAGVLFATSVCNAPSLYYPYYVFKYGFEDKASEYYNVFAGHLALSVIAGILSVALTHFTIENLWIEFIVKLLITFAVTNVFFVLCYHKNDNFQYAWTEMKNVKVKIMCHLNTKKGAER